MDNLEYSRNISPDGDRMHTLFDNIHGHIELPGFFFSIIDTPQFQRLRELQQLGCTYMVFPGGRHTRFEHCIGVGYLAGKMLGNIAKKQPELEISPREMRLVQIAGLCHDLGHGPYSHAFEGWVQKLPGRENWHHEEMSIKMLEYMIDSNAIDFLEKEDITFISELITGTPTGSRRTERRFLFDIVSNSRNSVDVDKFDYLLRDSYHLKITSFNPERLMLHCRVIDDEICFNAKSCFELYDMFHARYSLWKQVYSHRVTKSIEYMISDAYSLADPIFHISDMVDDPEEYLHLTDSIVRNFAMSKDPNMKPAQDLIRRIQTRDLYKMVDSVLVSSTNYEEVKKLDNRALLECARKDSGLQERDFILQKQRINYALRDQNPVDSVHFYDPKNYTEKVTVPKEEVALVLPSQFSEVMLRVFTRERSKAKEIKHMWDGFIKAHEALEFVSSPSRVSLTLRPSPMRPKLASKVIIALQAPHTPLYSSTSENGKEAEMVATTSGADGDDAFRKMPQKKLFQD